MLKKIGREIPADYPEGQSLFPKRPGNFTGHHTEDGASYHGHAQQNKWVGHIDRHQAVQRARIRSCRLMQRISHCGGVAINVGRDRGEQLTAGHDHQEKYSDPDDNCGPGRIPRAGIGTLTMMLSATQAITAP